MSAARFEAGWSVEASDQNVTLLLEARNSKLRTADQVAEDAVTFIQDECGCCVRSSLLSSTSTDPLESAMASAVS